MTCIDIAPKLSARNLKYVTVILCFFVFFWGSMAFLSILRDLGYPNLYTGKNLSLPSAVYTASIIYLTVRIRRHHKSPSPPNEEQEIES